MGDARFRFRPQINLVVQYNRYATFTNSWTNIENEYKNNNCQVTQGVCNGIGANEYVLGVQISVPIYDRYRSAKARETAATASHDLHEADNARLNTLDAQARIRHSLPEIEARADVAALQQQLAQQQLAVLRVQLRSGNPDGPQMTPADEQNALIAERDKYLSVLDADFQLHTTQIQLLRLTGRLSSWLKNLPASPSSGQSSPASIPAITLPTGTN